jgi:mono/diheme cytochrome c family protein
MQSRALVGALAFVALVACGDPDTNDDRGYTKAPLETPGLLVKGEDASPMAGIGRTNRPRPSLVEERQEAAGGGTSAAAEDDVTLASGVTQVQFDQGRELYAGQAGCQACHGPRGSGSMLGPDLTDGEWMHISGPDPDELAGVIRRGVPQPQEYPGPMPPMGGATLSDEQIEALAGYLASLNQG